MKNVFIISGFLFLAGCGNFSLWDAYNVQSYDPEYKMTMNIQYDIWNMKSHSCSQDTINKLQGDAQRFVFLTEYKGKALQDSAIKFKKLTNISGKPSITYCNIKVKMLNYSINKIKKTVYSYR